MKNILLTIAYDGTDFCGFQKQPGQRTVQGELERALSKICNQQIQISGTSRTDSGVHAYGQRANFIAEFSIPTENIPLAANGILAATAAAEKGIEKRLAGDVAILSAEEMDSEFHARFNAVGKKYIYKISNTKMSDPFQRNYCYQVTRKLNLDAMKQAAAQMVGTHDFKCFQAAGGKVLESTIRTVYSIHIFEAENNLQIEIIGNAFLYNMVRIITGTLVEVGLGRKLACELPAIISSKNRQMAGHTAPPQGLYLKEVYFDIERLRTAVEQYTEKEKSF